VSTLGRQSEPSRVRPSPPISDERRHTVEAARQVWIRKLIDLSRRNNLLYYRPLKTGTLDLSAAPAEKLRELLVGESVPASKLLPDLDDDAVNKPLRDISRRALENLEEKGLSTLFLTFGMATWPAIDSGRPTEAPVLLLPIGLSKKEGSNSYHLSTTGTFQLNLVLLHVMQELFRVTLQPEELLGKFAGDADEATVFDVRGLCGEIQRRMTEAKGFEIGLRIVLGNFAFQKMAMVKDLQERANELATHPVIAAIAGDGGAKSEINAGQTDPDPKEFDSIPPENEFAVLDADSSQQRAIASVLAGQSRVIHGPPGTGKSQTITNLITSLAATGQRVLFVAEKKAALDVVKHRLEEVGLGHLAIVLHGADLSPRKVMQQVAHTLEVVRSSVPLDCREVHTRLVERRNRLNAHVARMHTLREPTRKSVYEMQGMVLRLALNTSTRWRGAELSRLTPPVDRHVTDLLTEAGGFASLFLVTDSSPWTGATLADGAAVQKALDLVQRMHSDILPRFLKSVDDVVAHTRLRRPESTAETSELADLLKGVQTTLSLYSPEVYACDLGALLRDLAPGSRRGFSAVWAWCSNGRYRRARKSVVAMRIAGKTSSIELCKEVSDAATQSQRWRTWSDGKSMPMPLANADTHIQDFRSVCEHASTLSAIVPLKCVTRLSIGSLAQLISALARDQHTPFQIPKLTQIENGLETAGAGKLVVEIKTGKPDAKSWPSMFTHAWLSSTLDAVSQQDPEVRGFMGATHSRYVDDFTHLDEERINLTTDRVRRAHGERAIAAMNANTQGEQLIRAEATKIRRHLPLRKVFAQAADVLTAVCPCWMASPLSVSQLLDSGRQYFDFVIFDEASQVLPEDAIPSILRGNKLVVAGDSKQLPPTTFFAAGDDEEYASDEDAIATEGYESLLDAMNAFLNGSYLDWHYRSRDESLINFSNHYIYQDRLVTFPGPGGPPAISHVLVKQEFGVDGQEDSSSQEVQRVVALVLEHARSSPDQTLGVITMGIRHMNRVQAALDQALEKRADLGVFFDPNKGERFFVKNLERVQGDERDAIIISIGYGKDRGGNLPLRFGPLLPEGGRRRLNVAVTRARQKLTVVSSFSHLDLDLARVRPGSGVELLRNYLQYASTNGKRLGDAEVTGEPLNAFEAEIFDCLSARGLKLIPQMVASHFRIDMVAEHPKKPGRYVLAIECDGATYHSSYTARDRDRLRQQQLENLGWRFHRIWSTDWFMRKEDEIQRAQRAFNESVEFADKLDGGAAQNNHSNGLHHDTPSATPKRGPRPPVPVRTSINEYREGELIQLLKWITSDGQLRTDDQIIDELVPTLGFRRRGVRIESAIQSAIARWRPRS
jgi:very-short-patch-repair endonuclease